MPRLYLDVCCLNRPFDDQTQDRVRLEAEAVLLILTRLEEGEEWQWIGTEALDFEIDQTPDLERRLQVKLVAAHAHHSVLVERTEIERAEQLEALGFHPFDALHIACAESGGVEVFLTTDDQLLRLACRLSGGLRLRVGNPLVWLREVMER